MHQSKAISEQSSKFLCNTVDLWIDASNKTISERSSKFPCVTDVYGVLYLSKAISGQSSKFLCSTDYLYSYASKQSNFGSMF